MSSSDVVKYSMRELSRGLSATAELLVWQYMQQSFALRYVTGVHDDIHDRGRSEDTRTRSV